MVYSAANPAGALVMRGIQEAMRKLRFESTVERMPPAGFRLSIWNRQPKLRPAAVVRADEVGRSGNEELLRARAVGLWTAAGGVSIAEPCRIAS